MACLFDAVCFEKDVMLTIQLKMRKFNITVFISKTTLVEWKQNQAVCYKKRYVFNTYTEHAKRKKLKLIKIH